MGRPKAGVELAGHPLIAYPVTAAVEAGLEPFVVAKHGSALPDLACPVTYEPDEPVHPLTGILAALDAAGGPDVLVLGCDMPFLSAGLLRALAGHVAPAAAELDGRLEPLLAVYGRRDKPPLARMLEERLPLRKALDALEPERLDEEWLARFGDPARLAFSVNRPEDLARAARWMAGS